MTKSQDEAEIRAYAVERLRALMPSARIVHELNVSGTGSNRIDVAAITEKAIVGVEVKSRKDTLTRLEDQWAAFTACCHFVIVVAHDKHFADYRDSFWRDDVPSEPMLNHPLFFGKTGGKQKHVWRYPTPCGLRYGREFHPFKDTLIQPRAQAMLEMLWASELRAECARHRINSSSRSTRPDMVRDMVWMMTGREICHAVCRQLRRRDFAEADAAIGGDA